MTQFEYIAIAYSMVLSFTILRALSVLPHAVRVRSDEDNRLPFALLAVGKCRSVDRGCLCGSERGARHPVSFAGDCSLVKHIGRRGLVGLRP